MTAKIIYTETDEAPALATHSLLPIIKAFTAKAGIAIETSDISLAARILTRFPEALSEEHRVPDTLAVMPQIAANALGHPGAQLRLAGITGTNGKTTCSFLVAAMLRAAHRPHARLGTTGNWIVDRAEPTTHTTLFPLEIQTLLARALEAGATDAVMEVSSHGLDQARVAPLRFQAVGFTSFSQDHLDYHPTMEAYLEAKCLLPRRYLDPRGVAVAVVDGLPEADRWLDEARERGARAWRASRGDAPKAEIRATDWHLDDLGLRGTIHTPSGAFELRSRLVGTFNLDNVLVATGLGLGLGLELEAIAEGLRDPAVPGRLERVEVEGVAAETVPAVVVDYAHTPAAVASAIAALRPSVQGRLIVLLGCGGDRDPDKRPLMGRAAAEGADLFFATSDNPRTEDPSAIVDQMLDGVTGPAMIIREVDRATAIARAIAEAGPRDTVLLAGKGHETYQEVGTKRHDFDDREHARNALRARG